MLFDYSIQFIIPTSFLQPTRAAWEQKNTPIEVREPSKHPIQFVSFGRYKNLHKAKYKILHKASEKFEDF